MGNLNMIYISFTIDSWCWESSLIWIREWEYLMFTMMPDDKLEWVHISSQSTTLNITAEDLETEIIIDKPNIIFLSMNKSLAGIGPA